MMKRLSVLLACGLAITSLAKAAETPGDVEWAAKHAVTGSCTTPAYQEGGNALCVLYTVPAGKRLVVETVSFYVTTPAGSNWGPVAFGATSSAVNPFFFLQANAVAFTPVQGQSGTGLMQGFSTQMVKMYLAPGQILMGEFEYGSPTNTFYGDYFSFSGYLVDAN
jgi:hypothetical protein